MDHPSNFYDEPFLLEGVALKDIHVPGVKEGSTRLCVGMAINLYCKGHRDEFGVVYKRMLEDIQQHVGHLFQSRNDNGKLRKITAQSIVKEHAEFDPPEPGAKKRSPLVYITRYPTRRGDEIPPILHVGYADRDQEFRLTLTLPLEEDALAQATQLLALLAAWLPGLPLHCGTINPAMVYGAGKHWVIEDETRRLGEYYPALLRSHDGSAYLDGLVNWGMVTLLGPELSARMGGLDGMQRSIPAGFVLQSFAGNAVVMAESDIFAPCDEALWHAQAQSYRALSAWLAPVRSSTWTRKPDSSEKWYRMGHDQGPLAP